MPPPPPPPPVVEALDEPMEAVQPPPKKKKAAPPKEEDEGAPPPPPPPPKKAPAKKAPPKEEKKKAAGAPVEEEVGGPGLSKEEAEEKFREMVPGEIVSGLEEAKWQDKVEAYKALGEFLVAEECPADLVEASAKVVRARMKDWKEGNVNLVKGVVTFVTEVARAAPRFPKRGAAVYTPFLSEKLGDVKFKELCSEALLSLSELVTPAFVAKHMLKHASSAKSPNVLKENCAFVALLVEEFGVAGLPVKEMIDYAKLCAGHSNPQVRTNAIATVKTLYLYVGEPIRNFLNDIKDSTLKLIEEAISGIEPLKKNERGGRREVRDEEEAKAVEKESADPMGSLPRADLTKEINAKLLKDVNDG